jgi:hypothetical protein
LAGKKMRQARDQRIFRPSGFRLAGKKMRQARDQRIFRPSGFRLAARKCDKQETSAFSGQVVSGWPQEHAFSRGPGLC